MSTDSPSNIRKMSSTAGIITDDVHICGKCKENFTDINIFIKHKQHPCNASKHSSSDGSQLKNKPFADLVTVATENEDGTPATPIFHVYLDDRQSNQLSFEQESRLILYHLHSDGNQEAVGPILRTRLHGSELASHSCDNKIQENIIDHRRPLGSSVPMDDEDVASILANQLANEVISTVDPASSSNGPLRFIQNLSSLEMFETQVEITTNYNQDQTPLAHNEVVISQPDVETGQDSVDTVQAGIADDCSGPSRAARMKKMHYCREVECTFKTPNLKDLVRHTRRHTGERPFSCSACNKTFTRLDKLQLHQRRHEGIKPHSCTLCSYAAGDTTSLKKHMRIHSNERPYKCQICSYRSRDTSQLTVHLRIHTGDTPFACVHESCSSAFKTSSDLTRHLRMHTGEKPFECSSCDFRCSVKSNLRAHIKQNHIVSKLVECKNCDYVAQSKRAAKEHGKSHAAEVLKCGVCPFSCVSAPGMRNHLKTHSLDKPVSCKHCSYTCRFPTNLKRHLKSKHSDLHATKAGGAGDTAAGGNSAARSDPAAKPAAQPLRLGCRAHLCDHCDASFVREDSWRCHVRQHKTRDASAADGMRPGTPRDERPAADAEAEALEDCEPNYGQPEIAERSATSDGAPPRAAESPQFLERLLPVAVALYPAADNGNRSDGADVGEKSPPHQQILSGGALQATQPFYLYLANDGAAEGDHGVAPMVFANHCHYVTVQSDQYAVAVQGGGQYVLAGSPLERGGGVTFVQNTSTHLVDGGGLSEIGEVVRRDLGGVTHEESGTVIKKFAHQSL